MHDALAPLQGKTLVGAPELSDRPFEEVSSQLSGVTWKLQIMEDSKSLVLAKSDQIDFINPEGTPIVYLLEQAGWTDLLDNGDVVVNGPGGMDSRSSVWSASSAWAPTRTSWTPIRTPCCGSSRWCGASWTK